MPKNKILVAGTLAFDSLETPFGKRERIVGGSGNHFAVAASIFNQLELSAIIGEDFPEEHIKYLNGRGVGTSNVKRAKGKSFFWKARYEGCMNEAETLDTQLNVLMDYDPVLDENGKDCKIVFLANMHPEKQYKAMKEATGAEVVILDTMNYWIDTVFEEVKELIKKVQILIINEAEAKSISGKNNIVMALDEIVKMGPETVIIKRGEYGALLYGEEAKYFYVPAYPVKKVVDPTGAGDSFAGGFAGYLSTAKDIKSFTELKKAMIYGTVTASFMVEDFGQDRLSKITRTELDQRYKDLESMMSI